MNSKQFNELVYLSSGKCDRGCYNCAHKNLFDPSMMCSSYQSIVDYLVGDLAFTEFNEHDIKAEAKMRLKIALRDDE